MANSIYLAAPFFSETQIERVKEVQSLLKQNSTVDSDNIFVPMEHQMESEEFGSFPWQVGVFESDVRQVRTADAVVAILDYEKNGDEILSDSGTVFEVGMAYEHGVPVILVQFDKAGKMNLMLARSYAACFSGDDVKKLASYNFDELPTVFSKLEVF